MPTKDTNAPAGIRRRLVFELTPSLVSRFWLGVTKGEPTACWPWQRALRNGYGALKHNCQVLSAHVVAWVIANGQILENSIITHDCDNKTCCNPAHLKAGSVESNVQEMHERRVFRAPRGQEIYSSKLSVEQVADIWAMRASTGHGSRRISRALGLADHLVDGVLDGKNYRHLMPDWAATKSQGVTP
jgi:hypothetical protein